MNQTTIDTAACDAEADTWLVRATFVDEVGSRSGTFVLALPASATRDDLAEAVTALYESA